MWRKRLDVSSTSSSKQSQLPVKVVPSTNNITFGAGGKDKDGKSIPGWGYYEWHAGPSWHGTDGVHTHNTNPQIGDVEILQRRSTFVLLHQLGLRTGSGGAGKWHGGEGVIRSIEFLEPMQVSILSERRTCHGRRWSWCSRT